MPDRQSDKPSDKPADRPPDAGEPQFQNLHEIIAKARQNLNQNNWDYIVGATESETTLKRNRASLDAIAFRPRVLRDVSKVDTTVQEKAIAFPTDARLYHKARRALVRAARAADIPLRQTYVRLSQQALA